MLLGPSALRRRLPLILALVVIAMMIGAGFAALQTPVFRSTATVSGPADLATIVRSGEVAEGFRTRVAAAYGDDFASAVVAFASESGQRVELATESPFAGITQDLTELYTDAVLAARPDVVLEQPAQFPLSAHSPNLRRTALVSFLVGATLGWLAALALERRTPSSAATKRAEVSRTLKPIAAVAPLELQPQQATPQQATPQQATPQQATPQQATPQQATPQLAAPQQASPRIAGSVNPRLKTDAHSALAPRRSTSAIPRVVRLPDQS